MDQIQPATYFCEESCIGTQPQPFINILPMVFSGAYKGRFDSSQQKGSICLAKLKLFPIWLFTEHVHQPLLCGIITCHVCKCTVLSVGPYVYFLFVWALYICPVILTLGQLFQVSEFHVCIHKLNTITASPLYSCFRIWKNGQIGLPVCKVSCSRETSSLHGNEA